LTSRLIQAVRKKTEIPAQSHVCFGGFSLENPQKRPGVKVLRKCLLLVLIWQWFLNFFWSHTICGPHNVTTCHLVPGKLNLPNIIQS